MVIYALNLEPDSRLSGFGNCVCVCTVKYVLHCPPQPFDV